MRIIYTLMKNHLPAAQSVIDLIGNTPLVTLRYGVPDPGPQVLAKLEWNNPTGSVKDRMTAYVIQRALAAGTIPPGGTVVDNTSGNTGSALAMVCAVLGLRAVVVTPEKTSREKIDLVKAYGAEVIVTPTEADHDDPSGAYQTARRLARENGWFDLDQYNSQSNVEAHYMTTGPEIWRQTEGRITHFVCGIGSGGTFSGVARYLKKQRADIANIAVDIEGSVFTPFVTEGREVEGQPYAVEGIGSDVMTGAFHPDTVDRIVTISDAEAFQTARIIARTEGICGGGSSGAIAAAVQRLVPELHESDLVIAMFADSGLRYLSKCYNDDWLAEHGYAHAKETVT